MKDETIIVTAGRHPEQNHGVVNPPVYHASTIVQPSLAARAELQERRAKGERVIAYGRRGTPTMFALEDLLCELEGGFRARIYPSGLAAIAIALMAYVEAGDHVLVSDNVYGPCRHFCNNMLKRYGVETTFFDPLIASADLEALVRPNTKVLYLESPGSLTFEVQDVPRLAELGHRHGLTVMMDNTWATPLYFKPFAHGVDVSIHAATKYLAGHSDMMLGVVSATREAFEALDDCTNRFGQTAGPDDVYNCQRGTRTLAVRLKQHFETGLAMAEWFAGRPEVERVLHPALPSDPGHELWKRDFTGASGLFGIVLKPCGHDALAAFIDNLQLFHIGASWGGYESLVTNNNPNTMRSATNWPYEGPTVRFHAGLESIDDLIADLDAGLQRLRKAA